MDEIEELLNQFANSDDPLAPNWEIHRNPVLIRIKAQTTASFLTRGEALVEADSLVKSILELGYRERAYTEVGAIALDPGNPSMIPGRWRGTITLMMEPVIHEGL